LLIGLRWCLLFDQWCFRIGMKALDVIELRQLGEGRLVAVSYLSSLHQNQRQLHVGSYDRHTVGLVFSVVGQESPDNAGILVRQRHSGFILVSSAYYE